MPSSSLSKINKGKKGSKSGSKKSNKGAKNDNYPKKGTKAAKTYAPTSTAYPKKSKSTKASLYPTYSLSDIQALKKLVQEAESASGNFFLAVEKSPGTSDDVAKRSVQETTLGLIHMYLQQDDSPPSVNATIELTRLDVPCSVPTGPDCIVLEITVTFHSEGILRRWLEAVSDTKREETKFDNVTAPTVSIDSTLSTSGTISLSAMSEEDQKTILRDAKNYIKTAAENDAYVVPNVIPSVRYLASVGELSSGLGDLQPGFVGVESKASEASEDSTRLAVGSAIIAFILTGVLIVILLVVRRVRVRREGVGRKIREGADIWDPTDEVDLDALFDENETVSELGYIVTETERDLSTVSSKCEKPQILKPVQIRDTFNRHHAAYDGVEVYTLPSVRPSSSPFQTDTVDI